VELDINPVASNAAESNQPLSIEYANLFAIAKSKRCYMTASWLVQRNDRLFRGKSGDEEMIHRASNMRIFELLAITGLV
jgi:hypothetical protein